MSVVTIILVAVAAVVLLLLVGGLVANARERRRDAGALHAQLEEANRQLALAHAQDKGWDRRVLEAAAQDAFAERSHADVSELQLVQVVDRPGTEEDQAVFRVVTDHGEEYLHLDRRGDAWVAR